MITLAGLLFCGIGILFTLPIAYTIHYMAFADVTKLLDEHERGLESHLID